MNKAGERIRKGLEEAIRFARGGSKKGYRVHVPEHANSPRVRRAPDRLGCSYNPAICRTMELENKMPTTLTTRRNLAKRERLEARISASQKRLIERAAKLRGTSVTDFVVLSAHQAAKDVIQDLEVLHLRGRDQEVFVNAMLNPPEPSPAMRASAMRYKQRMGL